MHHAVGEFRSSAADEILAAEREHLRQSREFLELMRTDVLSLRAMGGDPVSEEYLKADLYRAPRRCATCRTRRCSSGGSTTSRGHSAGSAEPRPRSRRRCLAASTSTSAGGTCTTRTGRRS